MRVNEILANERTFSNLAEWKAALKTIGAQAKNDPYDENVVNAIGSRGHTVGYFNLQESFGEIKSR